MPSEEHDHNISAAKGKILVSTNPNYFLLHFLFLCGMGGFLTYCIYNGDLLRVTVGYDNSNNICGRKNFDNAVADKRGQSGLPDFDMRARPFLLVFRPDGRNTYNATPLTGLRTWDAGVVRSLSRNVARMCLRNCEVYPHYESSKSRCILKKRKGVSDRFFGKSGIPDFFLEVAEDLATTWKTILYLEVGSFALSLVITILFVWLTGTMVWLLLCATVLVCFVFTIYMGFLFVELTQTIYQKEYWPSQLELEKNWGYLAFTAIGTLMNAYLIFCVLTNRKRMEIIIQLHKESIRPITSMRMIFLLPLLTCICVSATITAWIYCFLWIESSGNEKIPLPNFYIFVKDPWQSIARWYNIVAFLWMVHFILDCQHMVVTSVVGFWYFCRNKKELGYPIFYGFYILLGYHLGSVSLGSLLTMLVKIPRIILNFAQKLFRGMEKHFISKLCLTLKSLNRDAYIEVGIYGYSFCLAGRQASKVIADNVHASSVKDVGTFVLLFANIIVCTTVVIIGTIILQGEEDLLHMWVILLLIGLFAYLISTCFFSLYQSIIDTIFLCYCEDYQHHDGISKPYLITKEFLEFIKNSEKLIMSHDMNRIVT